MLKSDSLHLVWIFGWTRNVGPRKVFPIIQAKVRVVCSRMDHNEVGKQSSASGFLLKPSGIKKRCPWLHSGTLIEFHDVNICYIMVLHVWNILDLTSNLLESASSIHIQFSEVNHDTTGIVDVEDQLTHAHIEADGSIMSDALNDISTSWSSWNDSKKSSRIPIAWELSGCFGMD